MPTNINKSNGHFHKLCLSVGINATMSAHDTSVIIADITKDTSDMVIKKTMFIEYE